MIVHLAFHAPGHDSQAKACASAITHTNQEKGGWHGNEKPTLI